MQKTIINEAMVIDAFIAFIREIVVYDASSVTRLNAYILQEKDRLSDAGANYTIDTIPDDDNRYIINELIGNKSMNDIWVDIGLMNEETRLDSNFNSVNLTYFLNMSVLRKPKYENSDFYKSVSYSTVILNILKDWINSKHNEFSIVPEKIVSPQMVEVGEKKDIVFESGVLATVTLN